jgi:hypothetical protein
VSDADNERAYQTQLSAVDDSDGYAVVLGTVRAARALVELRAGRYPDEDQRAWALARTKMDEALMWAEKATEEKRR